MFYRKAIVREVAKTIPLPTITLGYCRVCGSSNCLAFIRSHIPPRGLYDLADRCLHILLSDHWNWRVALRCLAIVLLLTAAFAVGTKIVWRELMAIGSVGIFVVWLFMATTMVCLALARTLRL